MSSKKLLLNKETLRTLDAQAGEMVAGGGGSLVLLSNATCNNTICCAVVSANGACLNTIFKTSIVINPDPVSVVSIVRH